MIYVPRKFAQVRLLFFSLIHVFKRLIYQVVMSIQGFLIENEHSLGRMWTEAVINTYPEEGAKFFSGSCNQFANPVGHTFNVNIQKILRVLIREGDLSSCREELDGILRIRAVQGFSPSVALCFLPAFKEIVYRELMKSFSPETLCKDLYNLGVRVDQLTMMGFDLYMSCREELWKQKANQLYNRTHKLLERANLLKDEEVAG